MTNHHTPTALRRTFTLALGAALCLSLVACADGGASDGAGAADTTRPASGGGDCAARASAEAVSLARAAFPDNADTTWTVTASSDDGPGRAIVEVEPDPKDVGYDRFRFVVACDGDTVTRLGTYALDGGTFVLLSTTDAPGASDLAPTLTD